LNIIFQVRCAGHLASSLLFARRAGTVIHYCCECAYLLVFSKTNIRSIGYERWWISGDLCYTAVLITFACDSKRTCILQHVEIRADRISCKLHCTFIRAHIERRMDCSSDQCTQVTCSNPSRSGSEILWSPLLTLMHKI
jgi:hypothetical protein